MTKYVNLEHTIRNTMRDQHYKKPLNEDYEYGMARNELATAKRAIDRLNTIMGKGEGNLEAWVQSKITKASDYLDTVADYLESGTVKEEVEQIDEISDKLAWSYANKNLKEPTPDVTTDAGFRKFQNRNAGLKLALDKQSYPKTSLNKAKVPTSDAADKEKKYQDAIKENETDPGFDMEESIGIIGSDKAKGSEFIGTVYKSKNGGHSSSNERIRSKNARSVTGSMHAEGYVPNEGNAASVADLSARGAASEDGGTSAGTKYRTSLAAANVGRPLSNKSKLAKQGEILKKKIDEEKAMAGNIKRIIFDKRKANSKETEVEFNPKLKKGLDEEIKEIKEFTDDEIRQNTANTKQSAAALKAQQISNAKANAEMAAKFQKGEISKEDLEKHYMSAQGQVASLTPGVKVAKKAENTSNDQVVGMTRGAENIANYSPAVTHQIAQGALKAAGGDYAGAAGHIAGAAVKPIASKIGSAASELVNAGRGWLSKIAGGSTNLAIQTAVPAAAAIAVPAAAAKAEEQPKPQEAQAKVETPRVEVGSPPKQETPAPVVKPAEAPTPSGMNPPPKPPETATKPPENKPPAAPPTPPANPNPPPKPPQPAKVASGEGKVGQELAKYGIGKSGSSGRLSQQTLDDHDVKAKLGSAQANMELLAKAKERAAATAAPKPEPEKPAAPAPAPEPQKAPETPAPEEKESGGKKKKVNESALIRSFISKYQK